jgi:V/A-type H+-transporting ATPase subunit K
MEMELEQATVASLGKIGSALGVAMAATGSVLGTGAAGMAAVGAWKKCFEQNKLAPMLLVAFVGAPVTQTFYGLLVMFRLNAVANGGAAFPSLIGWGLFGGLAIGMSAWFQGKTGAAASDALAETGKGFANYLMAIGVIESVALFVAIFTMLGV